MAQPPLHLIIGNYNTSSWSLRAWLVLRSARLAFIETRIPLRQPETPERIGRYSPSSKLPVLLAEGVPIWDSLAIAEFIAELDPGIWPLDPIARAEARSISAEVHSGFAELRRLMPMDVIGRFSAPGRLPLGLAADISRVMTIIEHCRARFAPHGPFLFGAFSIADAMMAPIATRLVTHGVPMAGAVEDYVDSLMAWPDMVTWCDAAAAEQAERETTGAVAVVSVTRPGRILGSELEAVAAAPSPGIEEGLDVGRAEPVAERAAAAAETVNLETAEPLPVPAEFAATTPHRPGEDLADAPLRRAATPSPEAGVPGSPQRRRLFEAAPPAATEAPAAPTSSGADEAVATPRMRPLGWLRHRVPADHFEESVSSARAEETARGAERQSAAVEPPSGGAAALEQPRPPILGSTPIAPAIKPIGGGIRRRR